MRTPAALAASRIDVPAGTDTCRPSIVRLTVCVVEAGEVIVRYASSLSSAAAAGSGDRRDEVMGPFLDQAFEIATELLQARHDRCRTRVAQDTDRLARHVVGDLEQRIEVLGGTIANGDPLENFRCPSGALATLPALRAALMREETRCSGNEPHEVLLVIDNDDATGAEHGPLWDEPLVIPERRFRFGHRLNR